MVTEISIFLDGADAIFDNADNPVISGFTTNPSLMKKAGVTDYELFAKQVLSRITDKPVSFEVLSDNFPEMFIQAQKISRWGDNVNVKIPITDFHGESSYNLLRELINENICFNLTAVTEIKQVIEMLPLLKKAQKISYLSVFAGRIADTGINPIPIMEKILYLIHDEAPKIRLIWASTREIYNVVQADRIGCDIITISADLLKKLPSLGKSLHEMSLDTVKMFTEDGKSFYIR